MNEDNLNIVFFGSTNLINDLSLFFGFIEESYGTTNIYHKILNDEMAAIKCEHKDFYILDILDRLMSQGNNNIFRNAHLIKCLTLDKTHIGGILMMELYRRFSGREHGERVTYTYIIKDCSSGTYKIGRTKDILTRFQMLTCGNHNLKIIATLDKDIEVELHQKYKDRQIKREWYNLSEQDIISIIEEHCFIIYEDK